MKDKSKEADMFGELARQYLGEFAEKDFSKAMIEAFKKNIKGQKPRAQMLADFDADILEAVEKFAVRDGAAAPEEVEQLKADLTGDLLPPEDEQQETETLEGTAERNEPYRRAAERISKSDNAQDIAKACYALLADIIRNFCKMFVRKTTGGAEKDSFICKSLESRPDEIAEAVSICRDVIGAAARACAIVTGDFIALGVPSAIVGDVGDALPIKEAISLIYDEQATVKDILDALPKTMEYMRQHAPEHAAELETYTRQEVKAAFRPILEYVSGLGDENAEPIEGEESAPEESPRKSLPFVKMSSPKSRYSTLDNITAKLFYGDGALISKKPVKVKAGTYGGKKVKKETVYNFVSVTIDERTLKGVTIVDGRTGDLVNLSPFYREVFSAICSIVAESERGGNGPGATMTVGTIYQALTGKNNSNSMTAEMKKNILNCIDVMSHYWITIDAEQEHKLYNSRVKPRYHGLLVPAEYVDFVAQGNEKVDTGIRVYRNSALFYCAEDKGQITSYPVEMLNAPINNTKATITLKGYLANRIRSKKQKNVILMSTLFDYLCMNPEDKTRQGMRQRAKVRNDALKYFEYCKNHGFVKSYEAVKKGHSIESIKFTRA